MQYSYKVCLEQPIKFFYLFLCICLQLMNLCEVDDSVLVKLPCYKSVPSLVPLRISALSKLSSILSYFSSLVLSCGCGGVFVYKTYNIIVFISEQKIVFMMKEGDRWWLIFVKAKIWFVSVHDSVSVSSGDLYTYTVLCFLSMILMQSLDP